MYGRYLMSYLLCTCTSCVLYVNKSLTLFPCFFTLYNGSDIEKHALWFIKLSRIQDASITSMVVTVHTVKRLGRLGGILCVKSGQKINFLACRQPFLDQIFYIGVPLPQILNLGFFFVVHSHLYTYWRFVYYLDFFLGLLMRKYQLLNLPFFDKYLK